MIKKFIILTTLLSSLLLADNDIVLSSSETKQGGFVYVEYPVEREYSFSFPNSKIEILPFEYGDKKYALIPVHYSTPEGVYTLVVTDEKGDVTKHLIKVRDGKYKKSYLKVTKTMETKRSDDNIKKGANKIGETKKIKADKLWAGEFVPPVTAEPNHSSFGATRYVNDKVVGYHSGMDFAIPVGTPIVATNSGKVIFADNLTTTGNTLVIDHGMNLYSSYCHMSSFDVNVGDYVETGVLIGKSGNTGFTTGPHLHFTICIGTTFIDPALLFGKTLID